MRHNSPGSQICLLVLGMHRSGTSATTRVLGLLGADLPKRLIDADINNQSGYWEAQTLNHLHEQMLAEIGTAWNDWRALDLGRLPPERYAFYKNEIKRLIVQEYGDSPLFAIKDPRICRFAGFYEEILREMQIEVRFIIPYRHPNAVAASLSKRDSMTRHFAALLWIRHVIDAEAATRGKVRVFLSYEKLLQDWRMSLTNVSSLLGRKWSNNVEEEFGEIELYLTKDLQHHVPSEVEFRENSRINIWTRNCYSALQKLEETPEDAEALSKLTLVRSEFNETAEIFGEAAFLENAKSKQNTKEPAAELAQMAAQLQETQAKVAAERSAHEGTMSQLRAKESELAAARSRLQTQENELERAVARIANVELANASLSHDRDTARSEAGRLLAHLNEVHASISWRLTSPLRSIGAGLRSLQAMSPMAHATLEDTISGQNVCPARQAQPSSGGTRQDNP